MDLAMMRATERDRELVADLACERSTLSEPQMMRIGWSAAANKAWLLDDVPPMITVTNTTRFGEGKHALIDLCYSGVFDRCLNSNGSSFWLERQQFCGSD